ncbi:uncharacterized protein G2W53_035104 [Senna tora]|uniref:Uncharacterized protein n=1 Tax=Senna tora TaxID=362788 RepID=A0A834SRS4_9FABA|nr:uncharacterized protein G2W53_035104 [Senna tora]
MPQVITPYGEEPLAIVSATCESCSSAMHMTKDCPSSLIRKVSSMFHQEPKQAQVKKLHNPCLGNNTNPVTLVECHTGNQEGKILKINVALNP